MKMYFSKLLNKTPIFGFNGALRKLTRAATPNMLMLIPLVAVFTTKVVNLKLFFILNHKSITQQEGINVKPKSRFFSRQIRTCGDARPPQTCTYTNVCKYKHEPPRKRRWRKTEGPVIIGRSALMGGCATSERACTARLPARLMSALTSAVWLRLRPR